MQLENTSPQGICVIFLVCYFCCASPDSQIFYLNDVIWIQMPYKAAFYIYPVQIHSLIAINLKYIHRIDHSKIIENNSLEYKQSAENRDLRPCHLPKGPKAPTPSNWQNKSLSKALLLYIENMPYFLINQLTNLILLSY